VTHGRQVKIGDFGLARDIEYDSNYVVRGNVGILGAYMILVFIYLTCNCLHAIFAGAFAREVDGS